MAGKTQDNKPAQGTLCFNSKDGKSRFMLTSPENLARQYYFLQDASYKPASVQEIRQVQLQMLQEFIDGDRQNAPDINYASGDAAIYFASSPQNATIVFSPIEKINYGNNAIFSSLETARNEGHFNLRYWMDKAHFTTAARDERNKIYAVNLTDLAKNNNSRISTFAKGKFMTLLIPFSDLDAIINSDHDVRSLLSFSYGCRESMERTIRGMQKLGVEKTGFILYSPEYVANSSTKPTNAICAFVSTTDLFRRGILDATSLAVKIEDDYRILGQRQIQ